MSGSRHGWAIRKRRAICLLVVAVIYLNLSVSAAPAFRLWTPASRNNSIISNSLWGAGFTGEGSTTYSVSGGQQLLLKIAGQDVTVTFNAAETTNAAQVVDRINAVLESSYTTTIARAVVVDATGSGEGAVMIRSNSNTQTVRLRNFGGSANNDATNSLWFSNYNPTETQNTQVVAPSDFPPFNHWDHRRFNWTAPNFEVPWSINTAGAVANPALIAGSDDVTTAVQKAFQSWEDVSPSTIGFSYQGTTTTSTIAKDGANAIFFSDLGGTTQGYTAVWVDVPSGRILEADIQLDDNGGSFLGGWSTTDTSVSAPITGANYRQDVQAVIAHEIGHLIGLGHVKSNNNAADPMMSYSAWLDNNPLDGRVLKQDDQDGANFLYSPDLGDAPDGPYPSVVRGLAGAEKLNGVALHDPKTGAEHIYGYQPSGYVYERLGPNLETSPTAIESEPKLVNLDEHDDGVVFGRGAFMNGGTAKVTVDVRINDVGNHTGTRYLNGWFDLNRNGQWEAGEKKVQDTFTASQVKTYTFNTTGTAGPGPIWARFRLDWLENVSNAAGYDQTLNQEKGTAQFGEVEDYKIEGGVKSGYIFDDLNGNGTLDTSDTTSYSNWQVRLYDSSGTVVATTSTVNGAYKFENVYPGAYAVKVVQKPGWTMTNPTSNTIDFTMTATETHANNNFLNQPNRVKGFKWHDQDSDGNEDPGEPRLPGWTIFLYDAGGNKAATTTTDASGTFEFRGVAPGKASLKEESKPGWVLTYPNGGIHEFTIGATETVAGFGFGNTQKQGRWGSINTSDTSVGLPPYWQDDNPSYNSPHGGYVTSSNLCRVCHATHNGYETSYRLLRDNSRRTECTYCHWSTGSASSYKMYVLEAPKGEHSLNSTAIPDSDVNGGSGNKGNLPNRNPALAAAELDCYQCHSVHGADTIGQDTNHDGALDPTQDGFSYDSSDAVENWNRKILRIDPSGDSTIMAKGLGGLSAAAWAAQMVTDPKAVRTAFCADCHNLNTNWAITGADDDRPNQSTHVQGPGVDGSVTINGSTQTVAWNANVREGCRGCHNATDYGDSGPSQFPHQSVGWKLLTDGYTTTSMVPSAGDPQRVVPNMDQICLSCHRDSETSPTAGVGLDF